MEKSSKKWNFKAKEEVKKALACSIRYTIYTIRKNLNENDKRRVIPLAHGDPSLAPCFRTTIVAEDAIVDAVRSGKYNSYSPSAGILQTRRTIANYLSSEDQYKLSPSDIFVTAGSKQAIEVIISVLACPGANILIPRPGYPMYESRATFSQLEVRHFDLLPEESWEVDLHGLEAAADDNTVAMVLINPGNPCGNVYTYEHLKKIAETARDLGILVIADEAYGHLAFGDNPFVPMRVFGEIAPIITLGSLSKRWMVPGWGLGWMSISDPNGILQDHGIVECIDKYLCINSDPSSLIQVAAAEMLKNTPEEFYLEKINLLREAANICYNRLVEIPCISIPCKPQGSMFVMAKLDLSLLEGITDDMDFCIQLAREESVLILPGYAMGMKNWLRITYASELSTVEDGLERIKSFCSRHAKN